MVIISLILCSIFVSSIFHCNGASESIEAFQLQKSTLQLIAIVHRHGFRAPEGTWPSDPYGDQKKYWPFGWGQLLVKGKKQLFQLGKTLQGRYKNFIHKYTAAGVRVNTSDYDRCHMSAASLMAGWFPPQRDQRWNNKLLWQPVPIHSVPTISDRVIALKAPCPKLQHVKLQIMQQVKANETEDDKKLYQYCTKHMGQAVTNISTLEGYYSTLVIEDRSGLKLPTWVKEIYPKKILSKAKLSLETFTWTRFQQRMMGGPLIKEILNQFQLKSEGLNKDRKVFVYSAHDITIFHILRTLQFTNIEWPDFGAALVFELHKLFDNKYYVKLLYFRNTIIRTPREMKIPDCQKPCSLKKLLALTEYVRGVDWDSDCILKP